jgi:hypothetical protein
MPPPLPSRPLGIPMGDSTPPRPAGNEKFLSIEIFIDMICPFCKRIFLTLYDFMPQVKSTVLFRKRVCLASMVLVDSEWNTLRF